MLPIVSVDRSGRVTGRNRRRDRHGRGLRGPLVPADLPLRRSRAQLFDDYVLDAVERLERSWPNEIAQLDFAVEDVPPTAADPIAGTDNPADDGPIPLARMFSGGRLRRTRIVLYRRPIEARSTPDDLATLVHTILVEEIAQVLGRSPEEIDPEYDEG